MRIVWYQGLSNAFSLIDTQHIYLLGEFLEFFHLVLAISLYAPYSWYWWYSNA